MRGRVRAGARRDRRRGARRHRQRPGQVRCAARARARRDGALVVVDSEAELERAARGRRRARRPARRAAGHRRRAHALRHRARARCPRPPPRARALGLDARGAERAPRLHRLRPPARAARRGWARRSPCSGRPRPAATPRPPRAWRGLAVGLGVAAIDLGGGFPAAPGRGRARRGRRGRPARRRLHRAPDPRAGPRPGHRRGGARVHRGGGQARWTTAPAASSSTRAPTCCPARCGRGRGSRPPDARRRPTTPALVSGPLCLNVDVLHPAAPLPELAPRRRAARARRRRLPAGAIDALRRPAAPPYVAHDDGRWRLCRRRETLDDLLAGDLDVALAARPAHEEGRP